MAERSVDTQSNGNRTEMANNSRQHSVFGLRYLKKLQRVEAAWLANKQSDGPRNHDLAVQVRAMRRRYREKYRPLPYAGVTLGRITI
jgi:hypothetical protein